MTADGVTTTISDLGPTDLAAIGELFVAHTGRPADLATIGSWIATAPSAGARIDGRLMGYLIAKPFAPDMVELASLLVDPDRRDGGTGARLVAHVERACRERGIASALAVSSSGYEVLGEKRSSVGFFTRLGYRVAHETDATTVLIHDLVDAPVGGARA